MVNETKNEEHQKVLDNIMANKDKLVSEVDLRQYLSKEISERKNLPNMNYQKFDRQNQGGQRGQSRNFKEFGLKRFESKSQRN